MGNVLDSGSIIAIWNLSLIEENVLDRIRNPDLLDLTASIDIENGLGWCWLGLCPNWKVKEKIFTHFYKGTTYEQFKQWGHRFTDFVEPMLNRQMVDTLKRHQAEGHTVCVVTASIDEWVRPVCERLGVSMLLATCIEVSANGTLTGRFLSPRSDMPLGSSKNCYGAEKAARLLEAYPQRQTYKLYAYGNSRGDREMLALADESFVIMQKWKSPTP